MKCTCSTASTCRLPVAIIRAYTIAPPTATATLVSLHRRRSRIFTSATSSATATTAAMALPIINRNCAGKAVMSADRISPTNGDDRITARLATRAVARRSRWSPAISTESTGDVRAGRRIGDQRVEAFGIDGLHDVQIETGFLGAPAVVRLAVAGQCDQIHRVTARHRADPPRDFVPIVARQADINQRHVR